MSLSPYDPVDLFLRPYVSCYFFHHNVEEGGKVDIEQLKSYYLRVSSKMYVFSRDVPDREFSGYSIKNKTLLD